MKALKETNIKQAIIKIKLLDDGTILVIDSHTTVRFLDKKTLTLINGFKVNISHLRYRNSVVDYSSDSSFFTAISADSKEARLYDAQTKKILTQVDRNQGEVSCVGIEPKNRYMFTSGDDGKTFATDMKTKKLSFTLPVHVDTVNDIDFSENGQWVATASYDKKIQVFNMFMMTRKHKLIGHRDPVMKVYFLTKNRLFSVDKKSAGIIWDYKTGKVIKRLDGIHDDVLHVTASGDGKFLFLGTQLGYVLVYELETYQILSKKYIKLQSSISALAFDKEESHLIVGSDDGDLLFYNVYEGEKYIKELLQNREHEAIQKYVEQNPLLAYTPIYELVNNLWETTVKKAKISLERGDKKTAINLFKHFKNIPSKNAVMQKIMLEYAEFTKFEQLARAGKLALAYSLVSKHPIYKDTKVYRILEANWRKTFTLAQKHAIDPKGAQMARDLLAPYRGISTKTKLIQDLLTQSEVYKRFRIAIGQKDYKVAFELVKQHRFLKEFADYESLMKYADQLYIKSQQLLNEGDTHSAIKILRVLVDFSDFTVEARELMMEIDNKQKFFNAVKDEDIVLAYNLLAADDDLLESNDGKKLQQEWNDDVMQANEYTLNGDIMSLNKVLDKYMNVSSKSTALGNIYGWCYMAQLEDAVEQKKDQIVIENAIKNYILYFGLQEQIESLFHIFKEKYPKSKLNLELQTKGSLEMWRTSMIVDSILE
ncbi:MAG: hypothetical protein U9N33_07215 [Campylobacterota bacterium]|nr:hypothetical protein [Campylobacterota bacterium]